MVAVGGFVTASRFVGVVPAICCHPLARALGSLSRVLGRHVACLPVSHPPQSPPASNHGSCRLTTTRGSSAARGSRVNARSAPHAQTSLLGSSLGDVRIRRSPWRGVLAESIESARGCRRTGPTKRWRQQQSEDRRQSGRRLHAALYHHGCERSLQGAPSRQSVSHRVHSAVRPSAS